MGDSDVFNRFHCFDSYYRPQRSCEGYVFTSVCLSIVGGVPHQVHPPGPGTPPGTRYTPQGPGTPPQDQVHPPVPGALPGPSTPPRTRYTLPGPGEPPRDQVHPPVPGTPLGPGTPPRTRYTPLDQVHPPTRYIPPGPGTPPDQVPPRYGHCRGRYASYWNAFLLLLVSSRFKCIFPYLLFEQHLSIQPHKITKLFQYFLIGESGVGAVGTPESIFPFSSSFWEKMAKTRLPSKMRTASVSGRLRRGGGGVCPGRSLPWGICQTNTPLWTDRHLWKYYLAPNFVCGR